MLVVLRSQMRIAMMSWTEALVRPEATLPKGASCETGRCGAESWRISNGVMAAG